MAKQVKIGFDKVPSPTTIQYPILIDIQGQRLTDSAGNFLVTEEEGPLSSFTSAEKSLSTVVNNDEDNSVPIVEQFAVESEVSNSLLGIPRAETQLGLFSDVATYGLDEDNWNFYTYDASLRPPLSWRIRKNPIYGRRGSPSFNEESKENALYLKSYPVQYVFPKGPTRRNENEPTDTFKNYMNFIAVGKFLYERYSGEYKLFADKNLIDPDIKILDSDENEIGINAGSFNGENGFPNQDSFFEIDYGPNEQKSMDSIERFTDFWRKIINGIATFPRLSSQAVDFVETEEYDLLRNYLSNETRPGGSSSVERFAILESKEAFRYQPGRVSGFTFGIRAKSDPSNNSNFIEWGASNDTDEYIFQIKGAQLFIIRRSTIALPDSLLGRMGLDPSDQTLKFNVSLNNTNPLYETIIPRSKWNGDRLDSSGPSGYILTFEDVTMYKIEFSWYGAVGAKFYAYVPVGVGDARWVLMHTLVIENGMGEPILENPNMKFKYLVYSTETSTLTEPTFIYKYGSSYFIDGGDEGTVRLFGSTGEAKQISERSSLMGILPKNKILNSTGVEIDNYQKIYPSTVSVISDKETRIDIEEIVGSPDGAHFHYAPCLHNGQNLESEIVDLRFSETGDEIFSSNTSAFQLDPSYEESKIIADGVYNCYIGEVDGQGTAKVLRRERIDPNFELVAKNIAEKTQKYDNSTFLPRSGVDFSARLTNYDTVAASTIPINSNKFKIHFLNPRARDGRAWAEFAVTVASKEPYIDGTANNELRFGQNSDSFDIDEFPYVEYCQSNVLFNAKNEEFTESDPIFGERMNIDYRLPQPDGERSGDVSAVEVSVDITSYEVESIQPGVGEFSGQFKITFVSAAPPVTEDNITNQDAEVGSNGIGLGIFYTTVPEPDPLNENKFFVYVDGNPGSLSEVQSKTVTLENDWKLDSKTQEGSDRFPFHKWLYSKVTVFNIQPLYLVIAFRDNAKVNNIVVEEINPQTNYTHTPNFIFSDESLDLIDPNGNVIASGTTSLLPPSNFVSDNRLSSSRFDTQNTLPLRPGVVINTFHIKTNKPEKINLENIFNFDRKSLSRGLYNNKAVFFNATSTETGTSEITLTVKEQ